MTTQPTRWQQRLLGIKEELGGLGEMRPGTLSRQYNVCGKPGCRCKDGRNPKKHGPYWQLSYTHQGKSTTEFVKPAGVPEVRNQIRNYARFRKLTSEWVDLALRIARFRKTQAAQQRSQIV